MGNWFEVSKEGLAKLLERRGKSWVVAELLQNAWDAPEVSSVELSLTPVPGRSLGHLVVQDNSPVGFSRIDHAFTLFDESEKKQNAELRGRFNLGEKLVLSLCDQATIATTTGTVLFNQAQGRQVFPRRRRAVGTQFEAFVRMTREEISQAVDFAQSFICPQHITTRINGEILLPRAAIGSFEMSLPTEISDADGVLRRRTRVTRVDLFRPENGAVGRIYEMGIPITETGDSFDVDIAQKVPLSLDRDVVSPAYLRDLRVGVLNHAGQQISADEANLSWVTDALESPRIEPEAVSAVIEKRFGANVVSFDPSDREANDLATAAGYKVLHGGTLTAAAWSNVRRSGFVQPAGRVTPSPKPFDPNGRPAEHVQPTPAMQAFSRFCRALGEVVLEAEIDVLFLKQFNAVAAFGSRQLSFNVGRLGKTWFEGPLREDQLDLVIHEFGHHYSMNHLSRDYNDALTRIGAKVAVQALQSPELFLLEGYYPASEVETEAYEP